MKKIIRLTESDLTRIVKRILNEGCTKGNCKNGYGEMSVENTNDSTTMGNRNGYTYKGQFKNGKKEGYATVKFNNGGTFKGHFKDNEATGYGTFTNKHGRVFQGEWYGLGGDLDVIKLKSTSQPENKQYGNQNIFGLDDIKKEETVDTTKCWYADPIKKPRDWIASKTDKNYEYYAPIGNNMCWWTRNIKNGKIFNLTELAKTNPNIQKSIDKLNKDIGTYNYSDHNIARNN
jgi:hypothetical protein